MSIAMTARPDDPVARGAALAESCLDRARAVAAVLSEESAAIEQARALTPRALAALHDAELYRLTLPRFLGGAELDPARLAQVTAIIAAADASAAWCLGQAFGCAMSAAFMEAESARTVFGPANAVLAWGAGAAGTAVAVDGGYRVSGTWKYASGGKHATWLGCHCKVVEADGSPRLGADGRQKVRTALLPREQAAILDDWHVVGLKGTRSEGFSVKDHFIEDALTLDRETPSERRYDGTLFVLPTTNVYASAFSGVALGIARAMLDALLDLAQTKTPRGAPSSLKESAVFHTRYGELEARHRAARAYQQEVLRETWAAVERDRDITLDQRVTIRLATTYAINVATTISEEVWRLAGSTAIHEGGAFERRFRDIHAVSQQVQGRHTNFESVGRHMLGLEIDTMFI